MGRRDGRRDERREHTSGRHGESKKHRSGRSGAGERVSRGNVVDGAPSAAPTDTHDAELMTAELAADFASEEGASAGRRARRGTQDRRRESAAPEPEFDRASTRAQLKQRFAQVEAIAAPLLLPHGLEIVLVEQSSGGGVILRISIDRVENPGTVTLEDCVKVSHLLGDCPALDELFPGKYHLEVSSPGVDRPLVRARDFVRFQGEKVQLSTLEPVDVSNGRKRFSGRLVGCVNDIITLDLGRDGKVEIPLEQIAKAQLKPDFADLLKRANQRRAEPDLELISSEDEESASDDVLDSEDEEAL